MLQVLSSTVINSNQELVSNQVCNPPDPLFFFCVVDEFHSAQYQSGSFSLIIVRSGFQFYYLSFTPLLANESLSRIWSLLNLF